MVAVRVTRHAAEVVTEALPQVAVGRQEVEGAFADDGSGGVVRVSRCAAEVLVKTPAYAGVDRQEVEAAFADEGSGGVVRVSRFGAEVLAELLPNVGVDRQEVEAAFADEGTGGTVRVSRAVAEVLARRGVPSPTSRTHPAGLDWFLHNWVDGVTMETSYSTSVTRSPITGAEERLALVERPSRAIAATWNALSRAELDRLTVTLRRATKDNLVVPLYQDAVLVNAASPVLQKSVYCEAATRRFFNNGRVAVFPASATTYIAAADVDVYDIDQALPDRVILKTNVVQHYAAKLWIIVPLMHTEVVLEPGFRQMTTDKSQVSLEMLEIQAGSALPPTFTGGLPDGWQNEMGYPIFEIDPNWAQGVETTFLRYGQRRLEGRKQVVVPEGDRYALAQDYALLLERADFWRVLQLFDAVRGRMGAFWQVDLEHIWTVTDTDPTFIDITPFGDYDDFADGFSEHVGIVMQDGTVYVRKVNTIQDVVGSWRITIVAGNDLPAIDVSQIARCSRARLVRFMEDALEERWHSTAVCETRLRTIELLNEKEVDLG